MPLFLHRHIDAAAEIGIWKIEEDENFFLQQLHLSIQEVDYLEQLKGRRGLEWLASRWLIHYMSGRAERGAIYKDEFGKPYIENSTHQISLSHSGDLAAVIAAPFCVGIDIQRIVPKITRIAHKFMREEETNSLKEVTKIEHLHVYWGAKEALYKAYGRKQLDFKEHIFVKPFVYHVTNGQTTAYVNKGDYIAHFEVFYERLDDYILVYALEQ